MNKPSSIVAEETLSMLLMTAGLSPPGCFVEVGVYKGGSAFRLSQLALCQGRELHLFDTFKGIPFAGPKDEHQPGDFSDVDLDALRRSMPDAIFHVGVFPGTLPTDLINIAFAHIDCDQYASVSDCIVELWPRIVRGGTMWFDDYAFLPGAKAAVLAHFDESRLQIGAGDRRFIVKI